MFPQSANGLMDFTPLSRLTQEMLSSNAAGSHGPQYPQGIFLMSLLDRERLIYGDGPFYNVQSFQQKF